MPPLACDGTAGAITVDTEDVKASIGFARRKSKRKKPEASREIPGLSNLFFSQKKYNKSLLDPETWCVFWDEQDNRTDLFVAQPMRTRKRWEPGPAALFGAVRKQQQMILRDYILLGRHKIESIYI